MKTKPDEEYLSLENLKEGGAKEMFDVELARVLENIADINTVATATRQVKLTVTIKPQEDRQRGIVSIIAESKLAHIKPAETVIYIGSVDGRAVAQEARQRTPPLFAGESDAAN